MNKITLTAPMRSNLLSLQQISKLQDKTQLRLASGLKVNSAIDNPSSYYTAQSLSSRANDLSANMLALQTRQSLATNSLSLASQASQSILKLF